MAKDTQEKEQNPVQEDYENRFNPSGSKEQTTDLDSREAKPDGSHDNVELSPKEQAQIDQMEAGLREDNLYDPSGTNAHHSNRSMMTALKGAFSGKKKYGWLGGGLIGMIIGGALTFFPVLGPVHIFSNLFDHNFEYNDSFRRNRTSRVVDSILNKNRTNRNLKDTPFSTKADLIEFERFETRMQDSGWSFSYDGEGRATGLIDPNGNRVGLDNTSRSEFNRRVQPLIDDSIPAWRMNKRMRTRSLISAFTGPRRSFSWSSLLSRDKTVEPDFEVAKFKKETGLDDINIDGQVVVRDVEAEDGDNPLDRALQETVDAKLDGATDTDAINAGVTEAKNAATPDGGRTSIVVGSVILGCIAYTVNNNELAADFSRYTAALRNAGTFMLATNEIQRGGDIEIGEVGQLFKEFNNFESTTVTATDLETTTDEQGRTVYVDPDSSSDIEIEYDNNTGSFTEAAAWQRATGSEVTGPELNQEFRVIQTQSPLDLVDGIMGILSSVGGLVSTIPGMGTFCDALFSPIGFIVGILFDAVEALGAVAACATGAGCAALGKFAVIELFWEVGSRMISSAMTAFIGFLTDNPVQSLAILDQSLNLTASEESRSAMPIDSQEYNARLAVYKREQAQILPFKDRYFALDNPRSVTAKIAIAKSNLVRMNPTDFLASLFGLPGNSVLAAITSQNVYAQTDLEFDNYGFQKYSYDNGSFDEDPFELAEEINDLIAADDSIYLNVDNGRYERDFAVMCMGYVPERGIVDKYANSNFLPRFSDPEIPNAEKRNEAFQRVCIDEANNNPELYAKVGRFVDDIEIVSSIIELTGEQVPSFSGGGGTGGGGGGGGTGGGGTSPDPEPDPADPPPICNPNLPPGEPCIIP